MKKFIYILLFILLYLTGKAQWEPTDGPYSGFIRTYIAYGSDFFAGSGGGGIIKTSDNGLNWTFQNNNIGSTDIKALVILNNKIFAGTDEGVFVSVDGGNSWSATGLTHTYVKALAVQGNYLYAGSYVKGMFRSSDEGASWTSINTNLPDLYIYCLASDDSTIFAGTYSHGIYISGDNGDTWSPANTGIPDMCIMSITVAGNRLFTGTLGQGVFVSNDYGQHWSATTTSLGHVKSMAVMGDTLFAGSFDGVYRSTDNGDSWILLNNGLTQLDIWGIGNNGNTIFAGTGGGKIYKSLNFGSNWTLCNGGIQFKAVIGAITKCGPNLISASHGSGIFMSTNNGNSYSSASVGTVEIRSLVSAGSTAFAGTDLLGIFRSTNNGATYTAVNNGLNSTWIQSIAINGTTIFAGTGEAGLFRSTNNGTNWVAVNNGLESLDITALLIVGNIIYVGTYDAGIFFSIDNGNTWTDLNSGLPTDQILCLANFNGFIYAGTAGYGIYQFDIFSNAWNPVSLGLPGNSSIRALANYGSTFLAGTADDGVFIFMDTGTWEAFNTGLTNTQIRSLFVDNVYLFAGTNGGGIFRRPLTDISIGISNITENPVKIYPNPVHELLTIELPFNALPFTAQIISTDGRIMLSREYQENKNTIDISSLSSGLYVLKINSVTGIRFSKIIID